MVLHNNKEIHAHAHAHLYLKEGNHLLRTEEPNLKITRIKKHGLSLSSFNIWSDTWKQFKPAAISV
jgi:hypothetical protein